MEASANDQCPTGFWTVPLLGTIPEEEYSKFKQLLHELEKRNIYFRFKYIVRLYRSGSLEQMVDVLKNSGCHKRKQSSGDLPPAKRKAVDSLERRRLGYAEGESDSSDSDSDNNGNNDDDDDDEEEDEEDEDKATSNTTTKPINSSIHRTVSSQTDESIMKQDTSTQTD